MQDAGCTKETIMKKHALQIASLFLLATFFFTPAHAQSKITVKVPFEFSISNKSFPAGEYAVSSSRGHLTVQDSTGKAVFVGIANSISGRDVSNTGQVVFHCYYNRCFLSEFWTPTRQDGSQLLQSRYERELARHRKGTDFALLEQPKKR
jgi:hypothetical protein